MKYKYRIVSYLFNFTQSLYIFILSPLTIIICFPIILYISVSIYDEYKTITLPNGYILSAERYSGHFFAVLDGKRKVVTSARNVMWCNNIIYGLRSERSDKHPKIPKHVTYIGDVGISYMFIYDRENKSFFQYLLSINYRPDEITHETIRISRNRFSFERKLRELGVPKFDYGKAVRYFDLKGRPSIVKKNETCRK